MESIKTGHLKRNVWKGMIMVLAGAGAEARIVISGQVRLVQEQGRAWQSHSELVLLQSIYRQSIQSSLDLQEADLTVCDRRSLALRYTLLLESEEFSGASDWSTVVWHAFFHSTLHSNLAALAVVLNCCRLCFGGRLYLRYIKISISI